MSLSIGSRLSAYEMLSLLGPGGMGEVYRGRDMRLGREVAIKVLPADMLADDHPRRRFLQETRLLSELNHPHIVTIHEIESDGDVESIVMELVRGTSFDAVIPTHGLASMKALGIAIPIAHALAPAHARRAGAPTSQTRADEWCVGRGRIVADLRSQRCLPSD